MIDDETNACRILNERHAYGDAVADLAETIYTELMATALKDVDGPVSFEETKKYHYELPKVNGLTQFSRRAATALEVLTSEESFAEMAIKSLILCAKKGDVDALEGLKQIASKVSDDIAESKMEAA